MLVVFECYKKQKQKSNATEELTKDKQAVDFQIENRRGQDTYWRDLGREGK